MRHLTRTAKIALIAGLAAIGLGAAGAVVVDRREDRAKEARHVEAMANARLSLAGAIRAAQAATPGAEVVEAKFKAKKDGPRYEVELVRGQEEVKLSIDPATGAVLSQRVKPLGADADEVAFRGARPSLLQAIAAAEAKGGRVLAAEYEMEAGRPVIELKVADRAGQVTETRQPVTLAAARPAAAAPSPATAAQTSTGN